MNYEEMLNAQDDVAVKKEPMSLGFFYRKLNDRKYRYVVELRHELADSLVLCEALRREQQQAQDDGGSGLARYELHADSGGVYELELHAGSYQTLRQLLETNPAVVAERGFISRTVEALMDYTQQLHDRGACQLCFAPQDILMTKGDNRPLLLCPGSMMAQTLAPARLYEGMEAFVAPEVLAGEQADERSDVYALGRLVESLYDSGSMPMEYATAVKNATQEDPDRRYATVGEMRQAIATRRGAKRSALMLVAALLAVGLLVWAYFDLLPESSNVEFVDNNGVAQKPDPFAEEYDQDYVDDQDEYMDPEIALFLDSITPMTDDEVKQLADSINTASEMDKIFSRRFTQQAKAKLEQIYTQEQLGSSETDFLAKSGQVMQELMDYAGTLGQQTGLSQDHATNLASQIISRLQVDLQKNVTRYGSMTQSE